MSGGTLNFSIEWKKPSDSTKYLTTALLIVSVDGETIWPVEGDSDVSLDIQADDLLSHLTEFWKPLVLRQTYPIGVQPERPSQLRMEAERRWEEQPASVAEREDELVSAFEDTHDISRCFAGQFDLPPFWFIREGNLVSIETRTSLRKIDFSAARDSLSRVGDTIAERLEQSRDERWSDLVAAWKRRNQGNPTALLAWSASLDQSIAEKFVGEGLLSAPANVDEAANDNDELRIAARMASALPPDHIRQVITLVSGFEKKSAPKLDEMAAKTLKHIQHQFQEHRPHEQGEAAASFVREQLDFASVQFIDVFDVVEKFGVSIHPKLVEPRALFALAVWGNRHGPAVLLNESGLKSTTGDIRRNKAARVTLAHELCHLLLDRGHALSAVEVLNSRMPLDTERRAKAFAGELLLPSRVAADVWFREKAARSTDDVDAVLKRLCRTYGVTKSVAAWKLEHGLHRHDVDIRNLLDAVVPNR